jgi:hypothetical protein
MKIEITDNSQDNTYTAKIWTGPDGIDHADFVCASLGECFQELVKYETINGLTYADDENPKEAIRSYFNSLEKNHFTEFELKELEKCKNSPKYFVSKYIPGIILRDYQEELFDSFDDYKITLGSMCRQSGKTLTPLLYALHKIIFNQNYTVLVNSFNHHITKHCLDTIKNLYYAIPEFFRKYSPVYSSNPTKFTLENGSSVNIFNVQEPGKYEPLFCGFTPDLTILDEYAFWNRKDALGFKHTLSPILWSRKSSRLIICSTPNSSRILENGKWVKQHFYELWTKVSPDINKIRVSYERVPFGDIEKIRLSLSPIDFAKEYSGLFITEEF